MNYLDTIKYKIIQAPMAGGIVNAKFVANVCNYNMLGCIPSGYLSLETLQSFIQEVKTLTKQPFVVNLFCEEFRQFDGIANKPKSILKIEENLGIQLLSQTFTIPKTVAENEYVDLLIREEVPIVKHYLWFFKPRIC